MRHFGLITLSLLMFSCGKTPLQDALDPMPIQPPAPTSQAQTILDRAKATHTDQLLVFKDGDILIDYRNPDSVDQLSLMSVTKSFMSLAVALLIDDGHIPGIDTKLVHYFPEWQGTPKKNITIRHILSHTSGLHNDETSSEIGMADDVVDLALKAELVSVPGEKFEYNSKAINVLTGLVKRVTGLDTDEYLKRKLFQPLDIKSWDWRKDRSGHAFGNFGLFMSAKDLAKVGLVILNEGVWKDERILSTKYIKSLYEPSQNLNPFCSLLWWISWKGEAPTTTADTTYASGWLGQYLVINPKNRVVGVRLISPESASSVADHGFQDFIPLLQNL